MKGSVTVVDKGSVRLHTYSAPEDSFYVNTQIVETPNRVIIIDAQFGVPYAREAAEVVRNLKKPIDRLIITHEHPDHYFGAAEFGAPIYALPEVRDYILKHGDAETDARHKMFGDFVPAKATKPQHVMQEGSETIDGIEFDFHKIVGGEAQVSLFVVLPQQGVLVAQDLVYSGVHLYLGQKDIDGWKAALKQAQAIPRINVVLPGHGAPGGVELLQQNLDYLDAARAALSRAKTGEEYKAEITSHFPSYHAVSLIDIGNLSLFPRQK